MSVITDPDIVNVGGAPVDSPSFTTTANFPDGTASVPSIAMNSDADGTGTGWYRQAANVIGQVVNGTEVWRYSASGLATSQSVALGSVSAPDAIIVRDGVNSLRYGASIGTTATSRSEMNKLTSAIANNSATAVMTITIPNAAHSCSILVRVTGSLGAGGAIGANEASASNSYVITIARTAGVNAVAAISSAFGAAAAAVAGAATVTCTAAVSAVSGAVGASNSFTITATIARSGGASDNHTCLVYAQLMNANANGVTLS